MEQFSLEKWLQDKSRKVVTRDGRPVRIVCWDAKMECPIMALALNKSSNKEIALHYRVDGTYSALMESDVDLFFADEKDGLTEFEEMLRYVLECYSGYEFASESDIESLKLNAKSLLDLARKELEKNIEDDAIEFAKSYMEDVNPLFEKVQESEELWKWKMSCLRGINKAYRQGKQDALKDLPKWKKTTENKEFDKNVLLFEDRERVVLTTELYKGEYYIEVDDLKFLPKEK